MYGTKRQGFAMIMAVFIIVLVALGGVMILGNVSTSGKAAADKYVRAQAELIADSATEFAVMRVQGYNGSGCLNTLTINVQDATGNPAYTANVILQYSFRNLAPTSGTCNTLQQSTLKDTMVLVDTTVTTAAELGTEPLRVHKRSWQKF